MVKQGNYATQTNVLGAYNLVPELKNIMEQVFKVKMQTL